MSVLRLDPFRQLVRLQDRLNRVFDESLPRTWEEGEPFGTAWSPAVDIIENENELILKAELPGIDAKDVDIRIENNTLTLRGERKEDKAVEKESYHRRERVYGGFVRSFTLPSTIEQDKVSAEFLSGVLQVTLPKREETKPKQISVKIK